MKVVSICNVKGGCGKTATASNIAYILAKKGYKTLLVDLVPDRHATLAFCQKPPVQFFVTQVLADKKLDPRLAIFQAQVKGDDLDKLYIMPGEPKLAYSLRDLEGVYYSERLLVNQLKKLQEFDFIILDSPPMLTVLSVNSIYAGDYLILPIVSNDSDSVRGLADLFPCLNEIKGRQSYQYKILVCNHDARLKTLNDDFDVEIKPFIDAGLVFRTFVLTDVNIKKAKSKNLPFLTFSPKSRAVANYAEVTEELLQDVNS